MICNVRYVSDVLRGVGPCTLCDIAMPHHRCILHGITLHAVGKCVVPDCESTEGYILSPLM